MNSREILEKLVAFPTVSSQSNLDLIKFCQDLLELYGFDCQTIADASGQKSSLLAAAQAGSPGGLVLSAHSDVVPVTGQDWTFPPFELTQRDNKVFGRGSTDMKGFLASMLYFASLIKGKKTKEPIYLCISYDEEIGCVGVRPMLDEMVRREIHPRACLVGEPTCMHVAIGHKGKIAADIVARGTGGHSALAPHALNAIYLLTDFIQLLRDKQADLASNGQRDVAYDVPYTTLHAGIIQGGNALNIVPDKASARFEIRNIHADKAADLLEQLRTGATAIVGKYRPDFSTAGLRYGGSDQGSLWNRGRSFCPKVWMSGCCLWPWFDGAGA